MLCIIKAVFPCLVCGLYLTRLDSLREHLLHHPRTGHRHTCPACRTSCLGMPAYLAHCLAQCPGRTALTSLIEVSKQELGDEDEAIEDADEKMFSLRGIVKNEPETGEPRVY